MADEMIKAECLMKKSTQRLLSIQAIVHRRLQCKLLQFGAVRISVHVDYVATEQSRMGHMIEVERIYVNHFFLDSLRRKVSPLGSDNPRYVNHCVWRVVGACDDVVQVSKRNQYC